MSAIFGEVEQQFKLPTCNVPGSESTPADGSNRSTPPCRLRTVGTSIAEKQQPHRSTRSSDVVTITRPTSSSSSKFNNRSFHHASSCLWNQLPKELRLPADHEDLSLSSDLTHVSSSFPSSPLSPSITPSLLHSRLKKYFQQILSSIVLLPSTHRTDFTDFSCFFCFLGHVGFNFWYTVLGYAGL